MLTRTHFRIQGNGQGLGLH